MTLTTSPSTELQVILAVMAKLDGDPMLMLGPTQWSMGLGGMVEFQCGSSTFDIRGWIGSRFGNTLLTTRNNMQYPGNSIDRFRLGIARSRLQ